MALTRSTNDKIVGGVCGGIARSAGLDPTLLRVAWAIAVLLFGFGLVPYLLLWAILPRDTGGTVAEEGFRKARQWTDEKRSRPSSGPDDYTV